MRTVALGLAFLVGLILGWSLAPKEIIVEMLNPIDSCPELWYNEPSTRS